MSTKPAPGTRKAEKFKDGQKKSGGAKAPRHAGPGRIKIALYEAGLGGARGLAIFLRLHLTVSDQNPQVGAMMMEEVLPRMPKDDRQFIQFVLAELERARNVTY
jgi:hypothetical protein